MLATPVAEQLHQNYPGAQIDFLIRKGNEGLFQGHPFINKVYTYDKQQGKWSQLFKLIKSFRNQQYDCIINVQRFFSSGLITVLSKSRQTIGFTKNPLSIFYTIKVKHELKPNWHEIDRNFQLAQAAVTQVTPQIIERVLPKLYPTASDFEKVKHLQGTSYICIAPASVWYTKQLPIPKWIELMHQFPNTLIYVLGGKADQSLAQEIIAQAAHAHAISLAGQLTYLQSAALMQGALMNYVNDSGPMHLASAVNAPVTVFYCSTIPAFGFGPLSKHAIVVQTGEQLPCRPCGLHGYKACPEKHFKCGNTINVTKLTAYST